MTMERIETVVGYVPVSWMIKTLEKVSDFITKGGTPTTYGFDWADEGDGIPFFRSECVTDAGFNPKGMNFIPAEAHLQMSRSEIKPGDLLMTITGNIGRVAKAPTEFESANINQHIARIRVLEGTATNPIFVYHCLKHEGYAAYYRAILTGQAYPQISLQQVRETPVALPPLPEQQKIAAILTAVYDKLDIITCQIDATQTLKRGLMQTLFSRGVGTQDADGRWVPHTEFKDSELGEIPVSWSERKASEICDVRDGTHDSPKFHEHGIPFYTSKNISNGKLTSKGAKLISFEDAEKFNRRSQVHRGDILMSMIGTVGEAALVDVDPDFCIKNVGMFKPDKSIVSPRYLLYFFQSPAFKTFVKTQLDGGIQKFLSLTALRTLKVPLPPLQEQNEIANFLDAVTWKFELLEARRTHFITLKRGLMQKLLTGEWRVKLDAEAEAA